MNLNKYKTEIDEISEIKDVKPKRFTVSNILLFREYQSRLYSWKMALNYSNGGFFNKTKSYHNLFLNLLAPWVSEMISEETVVRDLTNLGVPNLSTAQREYRGFFLYLYTNWQVFKDNVEIQKHSSYLKPPYEPIARIFFRGGTIGSSDNLFVIDNDTYRKHGNDFTLPSTNDGFLDYIDENCTDFPNQNKVNQLWANFQRLKS